MRRACLLVGIAARLIVAGPALAAGPPIAVALPECAPAPVAIETFLSLLRVELAAEGQPCCARLPEQPANPLSVAVGWTCAPGSDQVTIQVRDSRNGAVLDRQVALGDVSMQARPRALALVTAELIRTTATTPTPVPAVAAPAPAPAPPAATQSELDGWLPNAGFAIRTFPSGDLTLWGFQGGVGYAHAGWAVALEGFIESGNPTVPLGSVDTLFAGGQLRLGRRFLLARAPFEVALAGTVGVIQMDGVTTVAGASVASASTLAAAAGARVAYDFWSVPHDRARVRLVLEAGGVLRGLQATVNERDAAAMTGVYALAGLGFTLGPYGH